MSGESLLVGIEATNTLCGTSRPLLPGSCVVSLGVKRDVMAPSADHIILGWIWGSSNNSLIVAILEPSSWVISTWCSIIGLVGLVIRGVLRVSVSAIGGTHVHGLGYFVCGLCSWFGSNLTDQSRQWPQYEHPVCVKGELDFPSHPTRLGP